METTSREVHFSLESRFYERHARALMLEENWRGAIRFLQSTLPDLPLDIVVQVLQGKLSLKGDESGASVRAQDPQDAEFMRFQETYAWQHAGILQVDAEFYQPYGFVGEFGLEDEAYAQEEMAVFYDRDYTPNEYRTLRARFHAHHRESDLIRFSEKLGAVYFKRVPGPAFWHQAFEDWEAALADFRKTRRLENIFRGDETGLPRDKADPARNPAHWKFYLDALRKGRLREPRWDEPLLDVEALNTLLGLVEQQNRVQEALYAAQVSRGDEEPGGLDEETEGEDASSSELREEFETAVLRAEIRERARKHGGFIELTVRDYPDQEESVVSVPAIPLMRWAARNIRGFRWEDLPEWLPVCPGGLKMPGDNPMHTDWWVGAGFEPRHGYAQEHPLNKAAWRFALYLSESHGCAFVKLAGKGRVLGRVTFPKPNEAVLPGSIAVVPFAGVDYEMAMLTACKGGHGAVISAVGGKLAHLATVARETEARLVVVDNAMGVFKEGELVTLDLEAMTLKRHETKTTPREDAGGD